VTRLRAHSFHPLAARSRDGPNSVPPCRSVALPRDHRPCHPAAPWPQHRPRHQHSDASATTDQSTTPPRPAADRNDHVQSAATAGPTTPLHLIAARLQHIVTIRATLATAQRTTPPNVTPWLGHLVPSARSQAPRRAHLPFRAAGPDRRAGPIGLTIPPNARPETGPAASSNHAGPATAPSRPPSGLTADRNDHVQSAATAGATTPRNLNAARLQHLVTVSLYPAWPRRARPRIVTRLRAHSFHPLAARSRDGPNSVPPCRTVALPRDHRPCHPAAP